MFVVNYLSITGALSFLGAFSLGIFTLSHCPKTKENYLWSVSCFLISLWGLGLYFSFSMTGYSAVLFWSRFLNFVALLIPLSIWSFISIVFSVKRKYVIAFTTAFTVLLIVVCIVFPEIFIPDISANKWFEYYPIAGPIYLYSPLLYTVVFFDIYITLIYKYFSDKKQKNLILYILIGLMMGSLGGGTTYFLLFGIEIYPFGTFGVSALILIITYAMAKYEFLHAKLFVSRSVSTCISLVFVFFNFLIIKEVETVFDTGGILMLIYCMFVFMYGNSILIKIQTPVEKKFLKGHYNIQKIVRDISLQIMCIKDSHQLIKSISTELKVELEISNVFYLIKDETSVEFSVFRIGHEEQIDTVHSNSDLIHFFRDKSDPYFLSELSTHTQNTLQKYNLSSDSLIVPFQSQDDLNGLIILGKKLIEEQYTDIDKDLMSSITAQVMTFFEIIKAGENKDSILKEQDKELLIKRMIEKDLKKAKVVQNRILPKKIPQITDYIIDRTFIPARDVSGDYYTFFVYSKNQIGFVIADIVGKGIAASLEMVMLHNLVKSELDASLSPDKMLNKLNQLIYRLDEFGKYIPMVYGVLNTNSGVFQYVNAGHEPGVFFGDNLTLMDVGGVPLGMFEDTKYELGEIQFTDTDIMLLCTDGITDTSNKKGEDFGSERLYSYIKKYKENPEENASLVKYLEEVVTQFSEGVLSKKDDLTMISIEMNKLDIID